MRPRITVITAGVDDLERSVAFYRDGLGLKTEGITGAEYEHGAVAFFDLQAGLKLAVWVDEMRRNRKRLEAAREAVAVGAISGTVGTHASVPPRLEEIVCEKLGLGMEAASTQVIQRDRHAQFVTTLALSGASLREIGARKPGASEDRSARGGRTIR